MTLQSEQFGTGKISNSLAVNGQNSRPQRITVFVSGTFSAAAWTFSFSGQHRDSIELQGDASDNTITGSNRADIIAGAFGADTMTGGLGSDVFALSPISTLITIGGSGTSGTVSGYDIITDFTAGQTAADSEKLFRFAGATIASDGVVDGVELTLQLHAAAPVKSHSVSDGIVTFDGADTFSTSVPLTSTSDVAAAARSCRPKTSATPAPR